MPMRLSSLLDPFLVALLGAVGFATLFPARGIWVERMDMVADASIILLFFLHGTKLSRQAVWEGARNLKLQGAVLAATFGLFPLLGLILAQAPFLTPALAAGLLFLTLLPSTVQSSIAFTSIAGGNVAAALCAASFSNLIGIVATPALVFAMLHNESGTASGHAVQTIALQLLLPFVLGQVTRGWIGGWVARHRQLVSITDRGSILVVVYNAFGAAVVAGLWHRIALFQIVELAVLSGIILAIVLTATWWAARVLRLPQAEALVLLFCGSKKSLASGVPMAGVLFPAAQVGTILLPLMLFHQIQLIICAIIARHFADNKVTASPPSEPAATGQ